MHKRFASYAFHRAQVRAAVQGLTTLKHPLVLMPLLQFRRCRKLEPYEQARESGRLVTFDTWDLALDFAQNNTIVFFSHQWYATGPLHGASDQSLIWVLASPLQARVG